MTFNASAALYNQVMHSLAIIGEMPTTLEKEVSSFLDHDSQ
jgi:uncharacterized protein with HEPN domain